MVRFQHRGRSEKLGRSCPSALWAALIAAFTIGERQVISSAPAVARNFGPVFTLPAIGPENPISMSATTKRRGSASASDPRKLGFVRLLGPGLITGASDDDPSGIATYSQAGAQFGFAISWTMLFTYPLMVAIEQISARIGRTTGKGIAGNLRQHYPNSVLQVIVALLFIANTINIGADLGAMADAFGLLMGGPTLVYVIAFGSLSAILQSSWRIPGTLPF